MGMVTTDDTNYTAIADAIRSDTGGTTRYAPSEMPDGVHEVFAAGVKSEYDRFWDAVQENGSPTIDYRYKFFYWPNEAYKPKHPIYSAKASMASVFQNALIENTLVDVDFRDTITCTSCFNFCVNLKTVPRVIMSEQNKFDDSAFQGCYQLVNFNVEGTIGCSMNFQWSPRLSHNSLLSILNALADKSSDTSGTDWVITLGSANIAKLTPDEQLIAENKGWRLA
jgi:hypothetical protein